MDRRLVCFSAKHFFACLVLKVMLSSAREEYFRHTNWIGLQEHQEYMEQMELLLEEKIMLFEENQELKERIEELVSFSFTNF